MKYNLIEERTVELADYILKTGCTVRKAAAVFGISKSTVHKDMTERLIKINKETAKKVRVVLDINKAQRHIRGGMATKLKYLYKKS